MYRSLPRTNHLHNGCKWHNYSSPQRFLTKPSASKITNGIWMTIVYSAGSSPRHRPSDLLITHAYRKPPFTRWLKWWQLFFPPTDFDQTKHIWHHPWCVDEVAPSGLGVATPQAMNSRHNDRHQRDHDEKVALFHGQNQKSAIVRPRTIEKYVAWRLLISKLANYNIRYSKWGYRWARGQKMVMAKIATFAFGFFAFLLANLARCVPAHSRIFWAGALGWTP